jgi:hypothetical protein
MGNCAATTDSLSPHSAARFGKTSSGTRKPPAIEPLLVDSDTHEIRSKSSTAFDFIPARTHHGAAKPSSSPTRRPIIVPRATTLSSQPRKTTLLIPQSQQQAPPRKLAYGTHIKYIDLVFGIPLGAGTYGEVSCGTWGTRRVAIKKLFSGASPVETEEIFHDFHREVSILRKIKHDRIVNFLGFVEDTNHPFCLVFELLEGNVSLLLKTVRRGDINITFRVCLGIVLDTAEAMNYLHKRSPAILHRDLKAENLLLERNFRCKLTDFGLSRSYDAGKPSKMTICGTPSWVAPEVFRGEEYCEKVDVYSFGILLWEMFMGKKPYGDKSSADLPFLVGTQGLRPDKLAHVPNALNELMARCWDECAENRPGFAEIGARLERIVEYVTEARRLTSPVHGINLKSTWVPTMGEVEDQVRHAATAANKRRTVRGVVRSSEIVLV